MQIFNLQFIFLIKDVKNNHIYLKKQLILQAFNFSNHFIEHKLLLTKSKFELVKDYPANRSAIYSQHGHAIGIFLKNSDNPNWFDSPEFNVYYQCDFAAPPPEEGLLNFIYFALDIYKNGGVTSAYNFS
jgi:hypothetical protein